MPLYDLPLYDLPLYDYIIDGLENSGEFYNRRDHKTFELYLQSLQEPTRQLWDSYHPSQVKSQVRVDYSEASIQASYLLRYYPHYAYMASQICEILYKNDYDTNYFNGIINDNLSACFFGAGPCSELSGFIYFLSKHYPNTQTVIANVYDIYSWSQSRVITEKFIIPRLWKGELDLQPNHLDLCQSDSLKTISETIQGSQLFVFQNCLNEIDDLNRLDFQANLKYLFDIVPLNSLIIIVDLANYTQISTFLEQINDQFNIDEWHYFPAERVRIYPFQVPTPIIKKHLLNGTSGLIPRSESSDYKYMLYCLQKKIYS